MRIGVSLSSIHLVDDHAEGARRIIDRARAARDAGLDSCRGSATLRTVKAVPPRLLSTAGTSAAKRITLGRKKFTIRGGQTKTVNVRLTKTGYRVLLRARRLNVRVSVNASDEAGNRKTSRRTIKLKAPKRNSTVRARSLQYRLQ